MGSLTKTAVIWKTAITSFLAQPLPLCSVAVSVRRATNKAKRLGYCLASESEARRDGTREILAEHSTDVVGDILL